MLDSSFTTIVPRLMLDPFVGDVAVITIPVSWPVLFGKLGESEHVVEILQLRG